MPAPRPVFRELRPAEAARGYEVYLQAFAWLKAKGIRQWLVPFPEAAYRQRLQRGENFGVWVGDALAAILSVAYESSPYWAEETGNQSVWWLGTLATATIFRGHGLGRHTITEAVNFLAAKGASEVFLDCVDNCGFLPAFYVDVGFSEIARKPITYPSGNTFPMLLMRHAVASRQS
jgi:GNAT superfamily N-acetyltransferase